ncbi:hypothetical protein K438DRAFT_1764341 [Mycena galopus ATCC 62051]|nr:hypothetical protein K438DRAFT_1764341 [Mycena galopus ATCC 62051]
MRLIPQLKHYQDADALDGRLLFAIPKKGRLHEKCLNILYAPTFSSGDTIDCISPSSDIPFFVGKGNVDLGITGHDVILEAQMQNHVTEALRLGFGKMLAASPARRHQFRGTFRRVFRKARRKIQSFWGSKTKIEYIGGSVEAACALGLADGIVDLVGKNSFICHPPSINLAIESGDTMRAAGLHAIATLLESEAVLIKSTVPKHPEFAPLIDLATSQIAGVIAGAVRAVRPHPARSQQTQVRLSLQSQNVVPHAGIREIGYTI